MKHKRNILGTASHETLPFLKLTRNISYKFLRRLKAESQKTVPGVQQDRVPHFGCSVWSRRISLEPTDTDALRNRSGNIPEHKRGKPENEWGRLPDWASSWSRHLPQPDYTKLWPRRWTWQQFFHIRGEWYGVGWLVLSRLIKNDSSRSFINTLTHSWCRTFHEHTLKKFYIRCVFWLQRKYFDAGLFFLSTTVNLAIFDCFSVLLLMCSTSAIWSST